MTYRYVFFCCKSFKFTTFSHNHTDFVKFTQFGQLENPRNLEQKIRDLWFDIFWGNDAGETQACAGHTLQHQGEDEQPNDAPHEEYEQPNDAPHEEYEQPSGASHEEDEQPSGASHEEDEQPKLATRHYW